MKTLIKNGQVVTAVDDYHVDIFIDAKTVTTMGKGGLYGNVIRTGVMLNSTTDSIDKVIEALDAGLALR